MGEGVDDYAVEGEPAGVIEGGAFARFHVLLKGLLKDALELRRLGAKLGIELVEIGEGEKSAPFSRRVGQAFGEGFDHRFGQRPALLRAR